jgi:hypothetical protein
VAVTLARLRAERRTYFKQLLAQMKVLDGRQEKLQRFLRTSLNRKKGFIDIKDLDVTRQMMNDLVKEINTFASLLGKGFIE